MSVSTVNRRLRLAGAGGLPTTWPAALPTMAISDIRAFHVDTVPATDVVNEIFLGVDFNIALDTPTVLPSTFQLTLIIGGVSFFAAGLPAGEEIRLVRNTSLTQAQSFGQGDPIPESALELVADKVTLIGQDAKDKIDRTLRGADSDPVDTPLDLELPSVEDRASKYLTFDVNGVPAATATVTPGIEVVSAAMAGFLASTPLAAARTFLEIEKWEIGTAAARGATTPLAFGIGLWYESDTGQIFYSDGVGPNWVQFSGTSFGTLAARPAFGNLGTFYYATDVQLMYFDTGAAWDQVRPDSTIPYPPGHIWGCSLTWATATTMTVALGRARDAVDGSNFVVDAAQGFPMTKQINAAGTWTLGAGNNAFSNGDLAVAGNWARVFLMRNPTTGNIDWGCDASATAANLTADLVGYTEYRRIGWVKVIAGPNFKEWVQDGDVIYWDDPGEDYDDAGADRDYSAGASVDLAFCPPNVLAGIHVVHHNQAATVIYSPSAGVTAPSPNAIGAIAAPGITLDGSASNMETLVIPTRNSGSIVTPGRITVRTTDATTRVSAYTHWWKDARGRNG